MATWARTGLIRNREIPLVGGFRFTDQLRGVGVLDAAMPAQLIRSDGVVMRRPLSTNLEDDYWITVLWPCFYGQPVGAYFLTRHGWDSDSPQAETIHGDHASAILDRRILRDTLAYSQVDQNRIATDLLRYALGMVTLYATSGGGYMSGYAANATLPWITWADTLSGVLRDRMDTPGNADDGYTASSRKVIGQLLRDLSDLGSQPGASEKPGPDYRWLYGVDSATGLPQMRFDIGYPTVGVPASGTNRVVMEWPGGNVTGMKEQGEGTQMTLLADVMGQDTAGSRPVGSAADTTRLGAGYPLLARTWSESSTSQLATLTAKAAGQVAGLGPPSVGWSVTLDGARPPRFGSYLLGDHVQLRHRRGGVLRDRTVRLTGWTVDVAADGESETITPTVQAA